jgi:predicted DNA-binding protein
MRRKRGTPGRPRKPERLKLQSYGIRLTVAELERLDRYCRTYGRTRSAAIRHFIDIITKD